MYKRQVNICGRKRWKLFPPGQEEFLKDKFGNLAYDVDHLKDTSDYPYVSKLSMFYDIIQEAGEAIFVPSGWHHQVWNLVRIFIYVTLNLVKILLY